MYVVPITQAHMKGTQWLGGRVLDLKLSGRRFEPHRLRDCSLPFKSSPHFEKGHIKVPTPPIPHKNNQSDNKILEL